MPSKIRLIVTGSLSHDHIMAMPTRFKDHIMADKLHILNVSFIMDKLRKEFGGTGGNIAYSLGLLATQNILVASAGQDFAPYKKHLSRNKAINTTGIRVYKTEPTATGFAMTDRDDNQVWGFYQGAMKYARKLSIIPFLTNQSFVIIAPNDVKAMTNYYKEAIKSKTNYLFDPAFNIVHFKKPDLIRAVLNASIVIGNDYEVSLLIKKTGLTYSKILKNEKILITTLGAKGSIIRSGSSKIIIPPAKVKKVIDPTGAGDAYRAGFMAGFIRGFDIETCGKMGSTAAAFAVETYGTQAHKYTLAQFKLRYSANYKSDLPLVRRKYD